MLQLESTPYTLAPQAEAAAAQDIHALQERLTALRHAGTLTPDTLRNYYGDKRFAQVAESNALEGSPLSAGETEIAVLKGGTTLTGHDPAWVRDAIALDEALLQLTVLARDRDQPTDLVQLHKLHALLMGKRPGGGSFRTGPVRISGSQHTPPRQLQEIVTQMQNWQQWSRQNAAAPAPLRAIVLHAWLSHIHPYIDGNGRAARAISNLELVRAGYPPIIIRRKERNRYLDALGESDAGGDLRSFLELILERAEGALLSLERAAQQEQGYNPGLERIKIMYEDHLRIWHSGVALLARSLQHSLTRLLDKVGGSATVKEYESPLDREDYLALMQGRGASRTWCFILRISIPGAGRLERLAWTGYRRSQLYEYMGNTGGPTIYWSVQNPDGYPKWREAHEQSPYCTDMTTRAGMGELWYVRRNDGTLHKLHTTALAERITASLIRQISNRAS